MNQESIMMPFVHRKSMKDSQISDIENSISKQTRAWSKFNNRRNTSRIQHYFQSLHNKRITLSYNTAAIILCIICIWVQVLLINTFYQDSYQKQCESVLDIFYTTIHEHVIHTLREPTFFSDFFPGYFGNPYKYPLSAETAPIYVQSFLIAYQFTGGYVTSWKAGDINGKIVGIEFDEEIPNKAFLNYCNGTNEPTYFWESSIYEYNKSYPIEGGIEVFNTNYITTDWLVSGYNATGPLISELYIKRSDNTFIPLYTLVFPAINSVTHDTDFVFSFDLTLIKIQQFLRTINVSRNSRLAVTTNENVLIAVTGNDQPIDAFNNEIVTREISELSDPVWSCVSKDEAFRRHENFSTRCTITVIDEDDSENYQNISIAYNIFQGSVKVGKVATWKLIAAVENTLDYESPRTQDLYIDKSPILNWEKNFIKPFVTGFVITAIACFVLVVLYLFTPTILRSISRITKYHSKYEKIGKQREISAFKKSKTDILSSFGWNYSTHTRPIGILNAISELKIIQESSSSNEKTKFIAKKAIFEILENSFGCPTFNEADTFSRINNQKVREKLRTMFGNSFEISSNEKDDDENIEEDEDLIIDDQEIMRKRRSSLSFKNKTFNEIQLSLVNNSSHQSKRLTNSSVASKNSEVSEKSEKSDFQSNNQNPEDESDPVQSIVSIISATNTYFNETDFDEIISKTLSQIPNEQIFIVINSFFFVEGLFHFQRQLETTLFDKDMRLALCIAMISFHVAMKSRRIQNDEIENDTQVIERLFLDDDQTIFKTARLILYELYKSKTKDSFVTSENEVAPLNNDDDDDYSQSYQESETKSRNIKATEDDVRWTKICEFTFEILNSTPLSSHVEVITKAQLFLTSELIVTKLTKNESMILLKLLFVTSMNSFLFEKKKAKVGISLLKLKRKEENNNNNDDDVEIDIDYTDEDGFALSCLFENLIYPEMNALNRIFRSKFVRYSRKNLYCL